MRLGTIEAAIGPGELFAGADPRARHVDMHLAQRRTLRPTTDEKRHWRAMFDHYVFSDAPAVAAHIPEAERGVLAPLTPDSAGKLRAFLLRALSR